MPEKYMEYKLSKLSLKTKILAIIILLPINAVADVIWPAIYVADSHSHFWLATILGLLGEAGIFRWRLIPSIKKALLVSLVANSISATLGLYILVFGMLGWHLVVDNFVRGTFADFNKISTIIIMMAGSTFIEMLVARGIWKYPLRKTVSIFIVGNVLSYAVVIVDLYFWGGWSRHY